jgi:hypothetical protein
MTTATLTTDPRKDPMTNAVRIARSFDTSDEFVGEFAPKIHAKLDAALLERLVPVFELVRHSPSDADAAEGTPEDAVQFARHALFNFINDYQSLESVLVDLITAVLRINEPTTPQENT